MFEAIISGITFGLALAFMLGPVFFTLLQTSIQEGFRAGLFFAAGVIVSDLLLIVVCYLFASQVNLMNEHRDTMGVIGGLVLCSFGVVQLLKKTKVVELQDRKKAVHARYTLRGFLLNTLNPMVLLFWLSVVGIVALREQYSTADELAFFISVIGTVFSTDMLKSYLSVRLKRLLTEKAIRRLNLFTGIVLIGFGAEMVIRMLFFSPSV
jgi:threonine/homoserine/homoserine lactone efflux protein